MRTTLELPDPLFNQAKRLARQRKIPFRTVVAEALRRYLEQPAGPKRFKLEDGSFKGDGLVEGLTETDWERLRDVAYEGRGG